MYSAHAVQEYRAGQQEAMNAERKAMRTEESGQNVVLTNHIATMGHAAINNFFKMGMAAQSSSSPGGASPGGLFLHDNSPEPDLIHNPGACTSAHTPVATYHWQPSDVALRLPLPQVTYCSGHPQVVARARAAVARARARAGQSSAGRLLTATHTPWPSSTTSSAAWTSGIFPAQSVPHS